MDSPFLMVVIAIMAGSAARRYRPPDGPREAERSRRLWRGARLLLATFAFVYAGMAAAAAIAILCGIALGSEPREPVLLLMVAGLAVWAVFFAWIGLRLERFGDLLIRVKRACNAAVDAFFAADGKPKPEIDRDLD